MASAWETRFAELVRRAVGWRESSALEVLPDLMPVLPVIDAADPAVRLTRRERRFAGWTIIGAGVGLAGTVQLYNPAGSNMLVTLEEAKLFGGSSEWYADLFTGVGGGTVVPGKPCDGRIPTNSQAVMTGQQAGVGTYNLWRSLYSSAANTPIVWQPGVVIPPDGRLELQSATVNQVALAWLMWSERVSKDEATLRG